MKLHILGLFPEATYISNGKHSVNCVTKGKLLRQKGENMEAGNNKQSGIDFLSGETKIIVGRTIKLNGRYFGIVNEK